MFCSLWYLCHVQAISWVLFIGKNSTLKLQKQLRYTKCEQENSLKLLFTNTPVPRSRESEILAHLGYFTLFSLGESLFYMDEHSCFSHLNVLLNMFKAQLLELAPVHIREKHIDSLYKGPRKIESDKHNHINT